MATALMMLRLFLPSTVGMADTGIGHRLLCALGLANYRPGDYEAFTGFIFPRWEAAKAVPPATTRKTAIDDITLAYVSRLEMAFTRLSLSLRLASGIFLVGSRPGR